MKIIVLILLAFTTVSLLEFNRAISYSTGAPDGNTGSPYNGQNCASYCHAGAPVTMVSGLITSNIPVSGFVPGTTYTITAHIDGPGHTKFGFQISPMDSSGNVLGSMSEQNSETQITGMGGYITHSPAGTNGVDARTWTFDWIAPGSVQNVTFYGAFNVANNNSSSSGDTIYTSTYFVSKDTSNVAAIAVLAKETGLAVYPNPLKDYFALMVQDLDSESEIKIYALNGSQVFHVKMARTNGTYRLPEDVPPGIYYIQVSTSNRQYFQKIIVH